MVRVVTGMCIGIEEIFDDIEAESGVNVELAIDNRSQIEIASYLTVYVDSVYGSFSLTLQGLDEFITRLQAVKSRLEEIETERRHVDGWGDGQ